MTREYTYEPIKHTSELSVESISSLSDLADILKNIHKRLESEGLIVEDGKIKKIDIIEY